MLFQYIHYPSNGFSPKSFIQKKIQSKIQRFKTDLLSIQTSKDCLLVFLFA